MSVSRRGFLHTAQAAVFAPVFWPSAGDHSFAQERAGAPGSVSPTFPTQPPELVREMVGVSHGNVLRVKELLARHSTLARAAWDWGFGDWEDALGAASHVGSREIAELLIDNGARPTIFSAAMLGQLDVVKAFVAASPGIEATPGPHGITLLKHATAGAAAAQAVVAYLTALPGADAQPASQPTSAEDLAGLPGEYVYGPGTNERIVIAVAKASLTFLRSGGTARNLTHVGDRVFYPAGAPRVQIAFRSSASDMTVTVHDPDVVVEARRSQGS